MKFRVEYENKIGGIKSGYMGMNKEAAQLKHLPWHHKVKPEHTIEVLKSLPKNVRINTEHHEMFEDWEISREIKHGVPKSLQYIEAHKKALNFEKLHKPFNVKTALKFIKQNGYKE